MNSVASFLYAQSSLDIYVGLVLGLPQMSKSEDAQISYVKGHSICI